MQTEKATVLAQSDLFQDLTAEDIHDLERITTPLSCLAGRILYRPGEVGSTLFLLKEGNVQLYHLSTDGRKLMIASLETGASFGEMALIGPRIHDCFAETVVPTSLYTLNVQELEQLLAQKPAIAHALLQKMGQRLIQLEAQLVDTTFKSVPARLATLLLDLASPQPRRQELAVHGLSHEELADRLGVYRETVSSALRELKDANLIELRRKHITIRDRAQLTTIAASTGRIGHS